MRKLLIVLALVLCMALPAAAGTVTVSTSNDLLNMVKAPNEYVDTIIITANISLDATEQGGEYCGLYISSDRILTLQIKEGCTLSVSSDAQEVYGIYTEGNLTIEGSGKITAHSSNNGQPAVYGVYVTSGDVTVRNSVKIAADGKNDVCGICANPYEYNVNVTIQDSVNITASGSGDNDSVCGIQAWSDGGNAHVTIQDGANITASGSGDDDVYGIYTHGNGAGSADVTVQNGVVSGELLNFDSSTGTITIYAGKFSGAMNEYCALGPDSTKTGTGTGADPYIVTNNASIKFNPTSLDVAQGTTKQQTVSVDLGVSGDVTLSSFDKLEVTPTSFDGITVEPSSKDGTITFDVADTCAPDTYTFSVFCQGKDSSNKTHLQTGTFTVTVSEPKPSTGSASNGGCNAGFAGLALATFALLAAKRKK